MWFKTCLYIYYNVYIKEVLNAGVRLNNFSLILDNMSVMGLPGRKRLAMIQQPETLQSQLKSANVLTTEGTANGNKYWSYWST